MAIDRRLNSKISSHVRKEDTPGVRVDPYPYIGVVKNNLDPIKAGRLQVWIPDLGGKEDDPQSWRTVSYASPYMGATTSNGKENKWNSVPHSYGMWMVPPDIGNEVIVIFVAGDPLRGYWIACVNSNLSRHMMPGIAASYDYDASLSEGYIKENLSQGAPVPVTEFNETNPTTQKLSNITRAKKPVHEYQFNRLLTQGLDRDPFRGTITSSSQRESPSQVFGISTPGRSIDDPSLDPEFERKLLAQELAESAYAVKSRTGGHTFVMDDGDVLGNDNLVRLRTSGGHQVMMNDSGNTLYISHKDGTAWIEFDSQGRVLVYAQNGLAVRTGGTLDLRADLDINIDAGRNLNMRSEQTMNINNGTFNLLTASSITVGAGGTIGVKAGSEFNVDAGGGMSLLAGGRYSLNAASVYQQSGGAKQVQSPTPITENNLVDTSRDTEGDRSIWLQNQNALSTIVTVAPTHEPFNRGAQAQRKLVVAPYAEPTYTGTDTTKVPEAVSGAADDFDIRDQPKSDCEIGGLTKDQVTALFAQIGKSESSGNYSAVNTLGYVGKYQWGYMALKDLKVIKSHVTSNSQLNDPNSWVGNPGPKSKEEFLANENFQEELMCEYTKRNYNTLIRIKALAADDPPEVVAGMLMTAHLLGPGGAKAYRKGESGGADAYGTTAASYFAKGKFAVANLSNKVGVT